MCTKLYLIILVRPIVSDRVPSVSPGWLKKRTSLIFVAILISVVIISAILASVLLTRKNQPNPDNIMNHEKKFCAFLEGEGETKSVNQPYCTYLCSSNPKCTHYTWSNKNEGSCFLKTGSAHMSQAINISDHDVVCGVKKIQWHPENWASNCDFVGNNFKSEHTEAKDCGPACLRTPNCTHFTWTMFKNGTCWMKNGNVQRSDAYVTSDETMVCGYVIRDVIKWMPENYALSCKFEDKGNDLFYINTAGEKCGTTCVKTSSCTHFNWAHGRCFLKTGQISKNDAVFVDDPTVVCGVIVNPN